MQAKKEKNEQAVEAKRSSPLLSDIREIVSQARNRAYSAVNTAMVHAYWLIGRRIIEEEQNGQERAQYGQQIVKTLSKELTAEFGNCVLKSSGRKYICVSRWNILKKKQNNKGVN